MGSAKLDDNFLSEITRAEDIILGSLGFGEDAKLKSILKTPSGYQGIVIFSDQEEVEFRSEEEPTKLEAWALEVLLSNKV